MPDIFISYSRKDSEQALKLADKLRRVGVNVWIDQQGLEGSSSWSQEIVETIDTCRVFLLLLSEHSQSSPNVIKEVSIAYESERKILPVELDSVVLSQALRYQLAGIQRVQLSDFEGILRSLERLGVAHQIPEVSTFGTESDGRKSLIVLPFEDLSPGGDNAWFADGLTGELIDSLGHVKSLRLIDRKTSMDLKDFRGKSMEIAETLQVRYFIEGTVRKFGEQIKISASLLDIETGDYLWQDSHRGEFKDIFDLQEEVARKVVAGLRLTLTNEEARGVSDRGTENLEAYELRLKAASYSSQRTHDAQLHAITLATEAFRLDPNYVDAYRTKAEALIALYRSYDRNPEYLKEAEALIERIFEIRPTHWLAFFALSHIYLLQGRFADAERVAVDYVAKAPDEYRSHFALGFIYSETERFEEALVPFERAAELSPDNITTLWNLVSNSMNAGLEASAARWATIAIPAFDRHLRLHPEDEFVQVSKVNLFLASDQLERARAAAEALTDLKDPAAMFNLAPLWNSLGEPLKALDSLVRTIEAGFKNVIYLERALGSPDFKSMQDDPLFLEVRAMVDKLIAEQAESVNQSTPA